MKDFWDNVIITDIKLAMLVEQGMGVPVHTKRSSHGFVINDSKADKIIHFSDGIKIKCGPNELHYLPKGSTYRVEKITSGNCWAINFDLLEEIEQPPFIINFRNPEPIIEIFKEAVSAWQEKKDFHNAKIRKCMYDIITKIRKEQRKNYIPTQKELLIAPAVKYITKNFTKNEISVKELSNLCNISEAYLRRIFLDKYSLTPKEYIINLRIDYAKQLLQNGQFSVGKIAAMCGYAEPCHFSREFSKRTGISPSVYMKTTENQQ